MRVASVAVAVVASGFVPSPSRADVRIASSLSAPSGVPADAFVADLFGVGLADAQSFITDDRHYALTSIIARVGNSDINPNAPPDEVFLPFAQLRADSGNFPSPGVGSALTTFMIPDLTGNVSDRAFIPQTPIVLQPLTRYWFVLGTLSDSTAENPRSFQWAFSRAFGPITGPGKIPGRFARTENAGRNWEAFNDTPFFLEARGIVVAAPEPVSLALFLVAGIPALGILRLRITQRKNA